MRSLRSMYCFIFPFLGFFFNPHIKKEKIQTTLSLHFEWLFQPRTVFVLCKKSQWASADPPGQLTINSSTDTVINSFLAEIKQSSKGSKTFLVGLLTDEKGRTATWVIRNEQNKTKQNQHTQMNRQWSNNQPMMNNQSVRAGVYAVVSRGGNNSVACLVCIQITCFL